MFGRVDGNTPILYNDRVMKYSEFLKMPRGDTVISRNPAGRGLVAVDKTDMEVMTQLLESVLIGQGNSTFRPEFAALDPDNSYASGLLENKNRKAEILSPEETTRNLNKGESKWTEGGNERISKIYEVFKAKVDELEGEKKSQPSNVNNRAKNGTNLHNDVYDALQARIDELEGKKKPQKVLPKPTTPKNSYKSKKTEKINNILDRFSSILSPTLRVKISINDALQKVIIEAIEELKTLIQKEYMDPNGKKISMNGCRDLLLGFLEKSYPGMFEIEENGLIRMIE